MKTRDFGKLLLVHRLKSRNASAENKSWTAVSIEVTVLQFYQNKLKCNLQTEKLDHMI